MRFHEGDRVAVRPEAIRGGSLGRVIATEYEHGDFPRVKVMLECGQSYLFSPDLLRRLSTAPTKPPAPRKPDPTPEGYTPKQIAWARAMLGEAHGDALQAAKIAGYAARYRAAQVNTRRVDLGKVKL